MQVQKLSNKADFEKAINENNMAVVHFYAEWATQCETMNSVLEEMANQPDFENVYFAKLEAELLPEISIKYKIAAVPTCIIFRGGFDVDVINGANPAELTKMLNKHAGTNVPVPPPYNKPSPQILYGPSAESKSVAIRPGGQPLEERIKALIKLADVMVFMKGTPLTPKCGFSRTLVGILNRAGIDYETYDILHDEAVRQGLKKFSNWPTYPQVYVKGELVGGLDIIQELEKNGELASLITHK